MGYLEYAARYEDDELRNLSPAIGEEATTSVHAKVLTRHHANLTLHTVATSFPVPGLITIVSDSGV